MQQQQQPVDLHPQPPMQFSNPQQLQPQMMLYPVQYVYDPQMLMPSGKPDEQVQQNQAFQNQTYLINVQNPPPWIQNRTNMVYMPQMQMNNLQPYIPQNMVQNPMFNYQYQPMIMQQDIRHMMPNLINQNLVQNLQNTQNTAQNPQRIIQNPQNFVQNTQNTIQNPVRFQLDQKQNLPILTQMLQNQPKIAPNQNAVPMHMIRPQFQNVRPQMITVNPISSNHTCAHHSSQLQKEQTPLKNEIPDRNEIPQKHEVPQHIINQIPEGLSVKTIYKVPKTATIRPNEYANIAPAKDTPKLCPKPVMKHNTTNTEPKTNYKRKIRDVLEQDAKESEVKTAKRNCEVKQDLANKVKSRVENNIKQINAFAAKHNLLRNVPPLIEGPQIVHNNLVNEMLQREDKLLRNTVYVQARGRINETLPNEMKVANNTSNQNLGTNELHVNEIKKIDHTSLNSVGVMESFPNKIVKNTKNQNIIGVNELLLNEVKNKTKNHNTTIDELLQNEMNHENNKINHSIGVDEKLRNEMKNANTTRHLNIGANKLVLNETNNTNTNSIGANESFLNEIKNTKNISYQKTQLFEILPTENYSEGANELLQNEMNNTNNESNQNMVCKKFDFSIDNEIETERISAAQVVPVQEREEKSIAENFSNSTDENLISLTYNDCGMTMTRKKSKLTKNLKNVKKAKSEEIVTADVNKKDSIKKYVLTHVLDGHIIQESNVPFLVQRPSISPIKKTTNNIIEQTKSSKINKEETEKPIIKIKDDGPINNTGENDVFSNNNKGEKAEKYNKRDNETKNKEKLYTNTQPNSAKLDSDNVNEENPFEHINTSIVKSWTVADVFTHLNNPSWIETAVKLREEEIDGESLLLVNKEQLLQIGISEEHAEILNAYLENAEKQ